MKMTLDMKKMYLEEYRVDSATLFCDTWFRGSLEDYFHDLLLDPDSFVSSYFNRRVVTTLLADHTTGRRNGELRLWTLMGLEVLYCAFE